MLPRFLGPYCELRILVFFPTIYGARASCLGYKSTGKNSVCNLQYGPRTRLVRSIYSFPLHHWHNTTVPLGTKPVTRGQDPLVQRAGNFFLWISYYPTVPIWEKISVCPLVQANMHTLTTVKFGSVRKPWTTFNVKYILDPE